MEVNKLRRWMRDAGLDVWAMIDDAISLAAADHTAPGLRARRDGIVKRLYPAAAPIEWQHSKCPSAIAAIEPISPPPTAIQKEEKVESRPTHKEDQKQQPNPLDDPVRLAAARKRLRENYLKAEKARTTKVTKVIEIPQIPIKPIASVDRIQRKAYSLAGRATDARLPLQLI